ncbi:hypothetical protein JCM8547_006189 [Rhodosporidiobolus lusitaniae]
MADNSKQAVVDALSALANSYSQLAKQQKAASAAIASYAQEIGSTDDAGALLAQFPSLLGGVGADKAGSPDADASPSGKRKRGPNKEKKAKDPNAPKRPPSAYLEYQNSVRDEFRNQYKDLSYSEVLKKIGLVWQQMSDEDKKPWHDITEAKKSDYAESKKAYDAEHGTATKEEPATQENGEAKPYAGKKRGRKSNAEKAAIEAEKSGKPADIPVEEPKKEKKAKATPAKKVAAPPAPAPAAESSSEEESDDEESEESDSEESSESEEEQPAPPPKKSKKSKK